MENKGIELLQSKIKEEGAEGYLLLDYESHNEVLTKLLGKAMLTRKVIAFIPSYGKPTIILHSIDAGVLKGRPIPFEMAIYNTWEEMLSLEEKLLSPLKGKKVLMDYSASGLLMRVAKADAGSVEFVKSLGVEVESSGNLLQTLVAVLTKRQYEEELIACKKTLQIKDEAFAFIKSKIESEGETSEYEVQSFIAKRFAEEGMAYDEPPLVANGKNASNPHYSPTKDNHSKLLPGDLVLIDMWAKLDDEDGVYADITWMGYIGEEVPEEYKARFEVLKKARDGVIEFLNSELPKRKVMAFEADDVARRIIEAEGYGPYFTHRVGHNIAVDLSPHGPGANLDNYETHDDRLLLEGTSFSDEPGIYAPDFGMRSETNIHIENGKPVVVAGRQEEIIAILK